MADNRDDGTELNPYSSPQTSTAGAVAPVEVVIQVDELRAFVGPRADRYSKQWAAALPGGSGRVGLPAILHCLLQPGKLSPSSQNLRGSAPMRGNRP